MATDKIKNPCGQFISYYENSINFIQQGLLGGITYSAYVKSQGQDYQVSCKNTIDTLYTTSVSVTKKYTGSGFSNIWNKSAILDKETGKLNLTDLFGNKTTIQLPIPDK